MNSSALLTFGDLQIDLGKQEVYRKNKRIELRKKEYELLEFLARNRDRVMNRLTILEYVWNYSAHVDTNTLEVHIAALRRKVDQGFSQKLVRTVHGLGYKLSDAPD